MYTLGHINFEALSLFSILFQTFPRHLTLAGSCTLLVAAGPLAVGAGGCSEVEVLT